jgi:hypothetical protein
MKEVKQLGVNKSKAICMNYIYMTCGSINVVFEDVVRKLGLMQNFRIHFGDCSDLLIGT